MSFLCSKNHARKLFDFDNVWKWFHWHWMILVIWYQPYKLESNVIEYRDYLDLDWITSVIHWNSISCSRFKYRVLNSPLYHHKTVDDAQLVPCGHWWTLGGVWWSYKKVHWVLIWLWADSEQWLSLFVTIIFAQIILKFLRNSISKNHLRSMNFDSFWTMHGPRGFFLRHALRNTSTDPVFEGNITRLRILIWYYVQTICYNSTLICLELHSSLVK